MTSIIIDTLIEYPELLQSNHVRVSGKLTFEGFVNIEIKTPTATTHIFHTIAQTMIFLDACDAVDGLIITSKFGEFIVL